MNTREYGYTGGMSKILVVYTTQTGSTERYARWIAEETDTDIAKIDGFDAGRLAGYEAVIAGGPTHGGVIEALSFLEQNWEALNGKHVYLFAVGVFPEDAKPSQAAYKKIPDHIRSKIGYSKLLGSSEANDAGWFAKLALKIAGGKAGDNVAKENIAPILAWVGSLKNG